MSDQKNNEVQERPLCLGGFTSKEQAQAERALGKSGFLTEELPAGGLTQESFDGPPPAGDESDSEEEGESDSGTEEDDE